MATTTSIHGRKRYRRRGAAALEFGLILPILITILFGAVDFGRFAYTYIAVTNAANAGAYFGSVNIFTTTTRPIWEARVKAAIVDEMCLPSDYNPQAFDPAKITVPTPIVTNEGNGKKRVQVQVSYPFETMVTWPWLPNNMILHRTVEMRIIR